MSKTEKELLNDIVDAIVDLRGKAKSLRGKKTLEIFAEVSKILPDVMEKVEELGTELESADKRELAIQVSLRYFNVKYLPDSVEAKLIGLAIDGSISMLNKWFGKDWIDKINKVTSTIWGWFKKLFGKKDAEEEVK